MEFLLSMWGAQRLCLVFVKSHRKSCSKSLYFWRKNRKYKGQKGKHFHTAVWLFREELLSLPTSLVFESWKVPKFYGIIKQPPQGEGIFWASNERMECPYQELFWLWFPLPAARIVTVHQDTWPFWPWESGSHSSTMMDIGASQMLKLSQTTSVLLPSKGYGSNKLNDSQWRSMNLSPRFQQQHGAKNAIFTFNCYLYVLCASLKGHSRLGLTEGSQNPWPCPRTQQDNTHYGVKCGSNYRAFALSTLLFPCLRKAAWAVTSGLPLTCCPHAVNDQEKTSHLQKLVTVSHCKERNPLHKKDETWRRAQARTQILAEQKRSWYQWKQFSTILLQ